ncbi:MAG: hypothetical protein KDD58_14345 [Bdellovibrionales bacterium]|nr:hypothetical protein [Bdellovibrionales bacterium]
MKILNLLLLLISLSACKIDVTGTGTGNPLWDSEPSNLTDVEGRETFPLYYSICEVLADCNHEIVYGDCVEKVSALGNVNESLGLQNYQFSSFQEIYMAINNGHIEMNVDFHWQCEQEVLNLSCELPSVQEAYTPDSAHHYERVPGMLHEVCKKAFESN